MIGRVMIGALLTPAAMSTVPMAMGCSWREMS